MIVGGFPCQDLSVAGKRAGLDGDRSGLFFEVIRVIKGMRAATGGKYPKFVVLENVPGLLSADGGRAFARVLSALAESGAVDVAWRVLDAQWFGVPQQRRRVFLVADFGAERAAEILALAEGVRRRTPKGRKAGAGVAGTLAAGTGGCGHRIGAEDAATGHLVYGGGSGDVRHVAAALTCPTGTGRIDFDSENFVLTPGGVGCQAPDATPKGRVDGLAYTLTGRQQRGHGNGMAVCVTGSVTHTLTAEGHDASEDGSGRGTPIVFNWQSGGDCRLNPSVLADALSVGQTPAVMAFAENSRDEARESELAPCLQQPGGRPGHGYPAVRVGTVVRRLMPIECERLMGWPGHWTRYRADGSEIADGPRYRMCGNGVVGTVAKWLALRTRAVAEGA